MPNRDFHEPVGCLAGAAYSYYHARDIPPPQRLLETIGGAAGGLLGAWAPDLIDPPLHPNHRNIGHGAANVVGVIFLSRRPLNRLRQRLRNRADWLAQQRQLLNDPLSRLLSWLQECFLRFLAGLLNGFAAGYVSHIFFDALTPQGINLVYRGC